MTHAAEYFERWDASAVPCPDTSARVRTGYAE